MAECVRRALRSTIGTHTPRSLPLQQCDCRHRVNFLCGTQNRSYSHCVRRFSVQSERRHFYTDHLTGEECYQRALDALKEAKIHEERSKEEQSAEQYKAWKKAQERSTSTSSLSEGVAVVRTIARQARRERKTQSDEARDWKQDARQWMEAAAFQHGHAKALVRLGNDALEEANRMTQKDRSLEEDIKVKVQNAMELYEMAGDKGSAEGWFNLGHLLWTGYPDREHMTEGSLKDLCTTILPSNRTASLDSFQKAVDLGDSDAMYFVGVHLLSTGDNGDNHIPDNENDLTKGLELVQTAADSRHPGALYFLALLYRNGHEALDISPCCPDEFVIRLDAAADAGDADALFLRAHSCYHGEDGYRQDYQMALDDFVAAAQAGNADAAVSAGAMLHQGVGVQKNQEKAFQLYQMAGEMGSKEGWRNVVACYLTGEGTPQCRQTAEYIAKTMLAE